MSQVYLAQARCLSSLGCLKDAIDIVRACVVSFEECGISNSLSRQFRVEFGSMLIDVGSFSEASEFFEKVYFCFSRPFSLILSHDIQGGSSIMIFEIKDASTLIGIGKLAWQHVRPARAALVGSDPWNQIGVSDCAFEFADIKIFPQSRAL
jgi:hypothetical protein